MIVYNLNMLFLAPFLLWFLDFNSFIY